MDSTSERSINDIDSMNVCFFSLDQIQRLSGHTADPRFLSHITVSKTLIYSILSFFISSG
jgi:hypothetical protein